MGRQIIIVACYHIVAVLYYPIFYSVTGVVQNLTVDETITRAKETFIQLMKRNLLFWIPVQFCAFYFVEENLRKWFDTSSAATFLIRALVSFFLAKEIVTADVRIVIF
jgi:hypothetical protein